MDAENDLHFDELVQVEAKLTYLSVSLNRVRVFCSLLQPIYFVPEMKGTVEVPL